MNTARGWRWVVQGVLVLVVEATMRVTHEGVLRYCLPVAIGGGSRSEQGVSVRREVLIFGSYTIALCVLYPRRRICWRISATQRALEFA